jgi:hypothetical protein
MMSSMAWARQVLSPATLHSVIGTVLCHCITRPVVVAVRWPTVLTSGCRRPVAHRSLQPIHHTYRLYLMGRVLHALRACGAALVA